MSMPMTRITAASARAARPSRIAVMVSGGSSLTATPTNRKEPPHRIESAMSMAHSRAPMAVLIGAFIVFLSPPLAGRHRIGALLACHRVAVWDNDGLPIRIPVLLRHRGEVVHAEIVQQVVGVEVARHWHHLKEWSV